MLHDLGDYESADYAHGQAEQPEVEEWETEGSHAGDGGTSVACWARDETVSED